LLLLSTDEIVLRAGYTEMELQIIAQCSSTPWQNQSESFHVAIW